MLRVTTKDGLSQDPLVRIIRDSCYGENASAIAELFRHTLRSYHNDDDGYLSDDSLQSITSNLLSVIPSAYKVNMVGLFNVYKIRVKNRTYRCTWREMLAKGAYNQVYYADLAAVDSPDLPITPAVVKVTVETEDFRVYLLENVLHAILCQLPVISSMVVPIRFPFKIVNRGIPAYSLAVVLDNPGLGHVGNFIENDLRNDDQMFSILTQLAYMLHKAQNMCRMMHRDLKSDNIMLTEHKDVMETVDIPLIGLKFEYPTFRRKLLFIDFGMTRIEYSGEYLACDCLHTETAFNPCHDLQYYCCTLIEDYSDELRRNAPYFYAWLHELTTPLFKIIRDTYKNYNDAKSSVRHKRLTTVVARETLSPYVPMNMLRLIRDRMNKSEKKA
jgi:hypothetical protein